MTIVKDLDFTMPLKENLLTPIYKKHSEKAKTVNNKA
jgi:hypothetical protein